ncbi:MAG TPA: DinB family protein, partial [Cellvibrionaceae bacterium]
MNKPDFLSQSVSVFTNVRQTTEQLCSGLSSEDMAVQSMPDCSPAKWHLAHTTWFFENFVVQPGLPHYSPFNPDFHYLFNSYYVSEGERHARPDRGLLTRPYLQEVLDYRQHINGQITRLLETGALDSKLLQVLVTGLHHEMQHQELLLSDILHLFSCNPLQPAVRSPKLRATTQSPPSTDGFSTYEGGLIDVGAAKPANPGWDDFHYDNEAPRHKVWLEDYRLQNRPISNQQWLEFMADGGYENPLLWLSDGWDCCQQ